MGWPGRDRELKATRHRPIAVTASVSWLAAAFSIVGLGCTIERADVRTPSGEPPESDTLRVRRVLEAFADGFSAGDAAALDTLLAEDLTLYVNGRAERGWRDLLAAGWTEGRGGPPLELSDLSIEMAGGELALATCRYSMGAPRAPAPPREGVATLILKRAAAGWQLTHMHLSFRAPRAPPGGEGGGSESR